MNTVKITEIFIPSTVSQIHDSNPFDPTEYIEKFIVAFNNMNFTSVGGVLYTKDLSKMIAYPRNKKSDTFIVPKETKIFGPYCISSNTNVRNIIFQNDVDILKTYSCSIMPNLERISLPYGKSIKTFEENTFYYTPFNPSNVTYYFGNPVLKCNSLDPDNDYICDSNYQISYFLIIPFVI